MKIITCSEEPTLLFQIAHADRNLSHDALGRSLVTSCSHPRVQELQTEPPRSLAERLLEGESLQAPDMVRLACFIGELRFASSNDRVIEGQCSRLHQHGAGRHHHTVHFQSFGLRVPEMKAELEARSDSLHGLAFCVSLLPTHRAASSAC